MTRDFSLKNYKKYGILFAVYWCIVMTLILLLISGTVKLGCKGICIDDDGRIYVGLTEEIRVFEEDGSFLRSISPKTSKGYVFSVENDRLLVDAAATSYVMDLDGTILAQRPYPQLPWTMKTPDTVSVHGKTYHITCSNFYYRVVVEHNGEKTTAVKMPAADLAAEVVSFCAVALFIATMGFLFRGLAKQNRLGGWLGKKLNKKQSVEER